MSTLILEPKKAQTPISANSLPLGKTYRVVDVPSSWPHNASEKDKKAAEVGDVLLRLPHQYDHSSCILNCTKGFVIGNHDRDMHSILDRTSCVRDYTLARVMLACDDNELPV